MNNILITKSINIISRKIKNDYRRQLKVFEINENQYYYMIHIHQSKTPLCQDDLVNHYNIDKAAVARAIKHLINVGYIEKKSSETDKRIHYLLLTKKAEKIMPDVYRILDDYNKKISENLSTDELKKLDYLLNKIEENI